MPELPETIGGHHYSTWTSWRDLGRSLDRREIPPPFILASNEVFVLRFRGRRGVDWGAKWDLDKLRNYHHALAICPTHAIVDVTYRWGRHRQTISKDVPVAVEQHQEYVNQIRELTNDFTSVPEVPEQPVSIE